MVDEKKVKRLEELRNEIRRQLLLNFYLTGNEDTIFLLRRI